MRLQIETSSYNERRFGRPYIAAIDFSDPKGIAQWGDWVGSTGAEGILIIDAEIGSIIMHGQKDHRKGGSAPEYGELLMDGTLYALPSRAAAYKRWEELQSAKARA